MNFLSGLQTFTAKVTFVNSKCFWCCRPYGLCCHHSVPLLWSQSCQGQYIYQPVWLCAKNTWLTDTKCEVHRIVTCHKLLFSLYLFIYFLSHIGVFLKFSENLPSQKELRKQGNNMISENIGTLAPSFHCISLEKLLKFSESFTSMEWGEVEGYSASCTLRWLNYLTDPI